MLFWSITLIQRYNTGMINGLMIIHPPGLGVGQHSHHDKLCLVEGTLKKVDITESLFNCKPFQIKTFNQHFMSLRSSDQMPQRSQVFKCVL